VLKNRSRTAQNSPAAWANVQCFVKPGGLRADCLAQTGMRQDRGMADIDFSLLDVPRSIPIDEPPTRILRAAIAWHFDEERRAPRFGCARAKTLDFDPLTGHHGRSRICGWFPNLLTELRNVPVEDLITARITARRHRLPQVFESGGTNRGARNALRNFRIWVAQVIEWQNRGLRHRRLRTRPGLPVF